jgi:hypothetical protein
MFVIKKQNLFGNNTLSGSYEIDDDEFEEDDE